MIKTLGELFNYTNDILLQGELGGINDVIEYFEEAQQIIAQRDPIEAPIYQIQLVSNQFLLPSDFQELNKIMLDNGSGKVQVLPEEIWQGNVTLSAENSTGALYLYYYKMPNPLNTATPSQIPDVDQRYLVQIAKYAAQMYYLVDDDEEVANAFKTEFFSGLSYFNKINQQGNKTYRFRNVW